MASSGRGYLLVFNVQRERPGSEVDTANLLKVFKTMGAEIDVRINPTGEDIDKTMREICKKDFTDYSYIAIAYFSHGLEDNIVLTASHKELIDVEKSIYTPLGNIPSLDGKLKWLILQNCRGEYDFRKPSETYFMTEPFYRSREPAFIKTVVRPSIQYPRFYAKFYATSPGMRAYRFENGSLFIMSLCKRLEKEYKDLDIISIMENVKMDVMENCRAMPNFSSIQIPDLEYNFLNNRFNLTSGFEINYNLI